MRLVYPIVQGHAMTKLVKWWDRLRVRQKDWIVVLVLCAPLLLALAVHVGLIQQLLTVQEQHQQVILARDHIRMLSRLSVDIEDGFRGYLLTEQEVFLEPMDQAAVRLEPILAETLDLVKNVPGMAAGIRSASDRLSTLLDSKRVLIEKIRAGHIDEVLAYVRSTKGLAQSNAVRGDYRAIEDHLTLELQRFKTDEERLGDRLYWGLTLTAILGVALGLFGASLFRRSISRPLALIDAAIGKLSTDRDAEIPMLPISSTDEIGRIARSFEQSSRRIRQQVQELEAINSISKEINILGPGGMTTVLKLLTERAAGLLHADICMVMVRHERMKCWIVEAASGDLHRTLCKSVVLWEEFPLAVQAFETGRPATGTDLGRELIPNAAQNLKADSLLAIPLVSNRESFGVLLLLLERRVPDEYWNLHLARGFAEVAAIAIANARLLEAAERRGESLGSRLKQLEQTAAMLAHDMKAPGERMEVLASMLLDEYRGRLDDRATRWLSLIQQNGKVLTEHMENILELARVGSIEQAIEAVDPAVVIDAALKARADELQAHNVRVQMAITVPEVPCHRAYLRQVFDNLISNAVKFTASQPEPRIRIIAKAHGNMIHFSVSDNGCGIPTEDRERVFQPFVRLVPGTKGSGIGLTIVRRIVEFYQGRIWIEPSSHQGCTVSFTLPILGKLPPGSAKAYRHDVPLTSENFGDAGDMNASQSS
jgi:signal transduction histidine kinase/CHASE3 domain sensor protein